MNVQQVKKLNDLIKRGKTGTPKQLAAKLNVSERTVYNYIHFIRNELKAPVEYNEVKARYEYLEKGEIKIEWWLNEWK